MSHQDGSGGAAQRLADFFPADAAFVCTRLMRAANSEPRLFSELYSFAGPWSW